ncbi:2-dehydropantoate 2-reductase [Pochonia chlamydosporia 170]|uniref:2-dehydropantoate 2-reductase n=1 Tax=Pochonia chlamydosporia 170 TaxID=1380566 RepID=A0A179FLI5_METCM|nr:2-dehydropantoate 2-reductase [Pochonia chlamydosporia 170]OAQ65859.1 2-dehydropantoate 2-reductase [Pochonia chlamydosporia 170]
MPSVLIYGGGCIGAVATFLTSSAIPPQDIVLVCRSNFDVVSKDGITINSTLWGSGLVVKPTVVRSIHDASKLGKQFDYVFITTKATTKKEDIQAMVSIIAPHTSLVLMQNGIAIEQPFHEMFPTNPILSVVLYTPVAQTSPGVFSHALSARLLLGTYPASAPEGHKTSAEKLKDLLQTGGASVTHEADIQVSRWKKILINASENPICALCRLPDATFFQSAPGAIQFMRDVMEEIARTARASGCTEIDDDVIQQQLDFLTIRELPGVVPSMMADALSGREMEVDALIGNVVDIAAENGVETPRLSTLYYLIRGLNCSFRT